MISRNTIKKRFTTKCEDLLDKSMLANNKNAYQEKLSNIQSILNKYKNSLNKNILFRGKIDNSKECFLCGLSYLPMTLSHKLLSVPDILNIFFFDKSPFKDEMDPIKGVVDLYGIPEDILLIQILNTESINKLAPELLLSIIETRTQNNKRTWIYFRGVLEALQKGNFRNDYTNILERYKQDKESYMIINIDEGVKS